MSESKAVAKKQPEFFSVLKKWEGDLSASIPRHMDIKRFIRTVLGEIRKTPKLLQCSQPSVLGAIFTVAQLGLEFVDGQAYMIPFWDSKKKGFECVLIIGYKGIKELYYRHPSAGTVEFREVCQNDSFEYEYGTNAFLKHKPAKTKGPVTHYYCLAKLSNGFQIFEVMTKEECIEHGIKHSKTVDNGKFKPSSPWVKDTDSMCKKTVFRFLSKEIPQSSIFHRVMEADESIRKLEPGKQVQDFTELPNIAWTDEGETEKREFIPPEDMQQEPPPEVEPAKEPNGNATLFDKKQSKGKPGQHLYDLVSELYEEIAAQKGQQAEAWIKDNKFPEKSTVITHKQYQELFERWKERGE